VGSVPGLFSILYTTQYILSRCLEEIKLFNSNHIFLVVGITSLAGLSIWIPDPVLSGSGIRKGKKSGSRIRDEHTRSYFRELRNSVLGLKYFNFLMRIRIRDLFDPGLDPGSRIEKTESGILINISDPFVAANIIYF